MHDREIPNTTTTGEHGTGHGSAGSDTHPNEGGAHAPGTTHGGGEHGQQHPEIDNSERTDVMKTTNMTTSTGAALSLALFLILTGTDSASGFTPQSAGGGEDFIAFNNGCGGYGGQQGGGAFQKGLGSVSGGGANFIGGNGTGKTVTTGGEAIVGGQSNGGDVNTGGSDGTQSSGGGLYTGGTDEGGFGGGGNFGLSGSSGGNGGSQDGTEEFGF